MDNMHELGPVEDSRILADFLIRADKSAHPVIGNYDRGEDLQLAARLQRSQGEEHQLFGHIHGPLAVVGFGEELGVVEPDVVDALVLAQMDAELLADVGCPHLDISVVLEPVLD